MDPFRQFRQNVIAVEKKRLVLYESQQIQRHLTKKKKTKTFEERKSKQRRKYKKKRYFYYDIKVMHPEKFILKGFRPSNLQFRMFSYLALLDCSR